jgi:hypothetical protein
MALKPCGECGEAIFSRAKACPLCGIGKPFQSTIQRNLDSASKASRQTGCALLLLGFVIVVLLVLAGVG